MQDIKISIILTTARENYPYEGWDQELFAPLIKSLEKQLFKDFELIIVDRLFHERRERFDGYKWIKHIPFDEDESPWSRIKLWSNNAQRNKGIVYAEGELLIFIADCSALTSPYTLTYFWNWYQYGYFFQLWYKVFKGKRLVKLGNEPVYDHRVNWLFKSPSQLLSHNHGSWFFNWSSISLKAVLEANGFDENFDGCKGVEDCDMGCRLVSLGYNKFLLDKRFWYIDYIDKGLSKKLFREEVNPPHEYYQRISKPKETAFKFNVGILQMNQEHKWFKANSRKWSNEDFN